MKYKRWVEKMKRSPFNILKDVWDNLSRISTISNVTLVRQKQQHAVDDVVVVLL